METVASENVLKFEITPEKLYNNLTVDFIERNNLTTGQGFSDLDYNLADNLKIKVSYDGESELIVEILENKDNLSLDLLSESISTEFLGVEAPDEDEDEDEEDSEE